MSWTLWCSCCGVNALSGRHVRPHTHIGVAAHFGARGVIWGLRIRSTHVALKRLDFELGILAKLGTILLAWMLAHHTHSRSQLSRYIGRLCTCARASCDSASAPSECIQQPSRRVPSFQPREPNAVTHTHNTERTDATTAPSTVQRRDGVGLGSYLCMGRLCVRLLGFGSGPSFRRVPFIGVMREFVQAGGAGSWSPCG